MLKAIFTDLRKFILKLELFLLIAGFVLLRLRGHAYQRWVLFCLCFLVLALLFPAPLQPLRRQLHRLSQWWGKIVTFVILFVVYFFALVPLGLLARLFGKEFLTLKLDRKAATYWIERERRVREKSGEKSDAERQY